MGWFLRFLASATALAMPAWWISPRYQRVLGTVAAATLGAFGLDVQMEEVQLEAPFDLAIFIALCVASVRAPRAARLRALVLGIPALMLVELCVVMGAVGLTLSSAEVGVRLAGYLLETVPWMSGGLLWLALLGGWVLPAGRGSPLGARAASAPRRGKDQGRS